MKEKKAKKLSNGKRKIEETEPVGAGGNILAEKEMIVQRLASEASGKAMKYERLGPQEFIPYPHDEMTIDNIKLACSMHFSDRLSHEDMVCDILQSQNGPSCSKLSHIKSFKIIHVRFIKGVVHRENSIDLDTSVSSKLLLSAPMGFKNKQRYVWDNKSSKILTVSSSSTCLSRAAATSEREKCNASSSESKVYPQSLSISSMLRLGRLVSKTMEAPKGIEIFEFNISTMAWYQPVIERYYIEKEAFAHGGFRSVFKAKDTNRKVVVIKKFLKKTLDIMDEVNETITIPESAESLSRKAVQMRMLVLNFAEQFKFSLPKHVQNQFGETFSYRKVKFGKIVENGECVMVEDYIAGEFAKYLNNDGYMTRNEIADIELVQKAECLAHFSYEKSNQELLLLDIQGSGYQLYDPEIATATGLADENGLRFCMGNLSTVACTNFSTHLQQILQVS